MKIKFSHPYFKLNYMSDDNNNVTPVKNATLVLVTKVNLSDLPQRFLVYDATYPNGEYPLKDGQYLLLLFVTNDYRRDEFIFTTLRPYNKQKQDYYNSLIGKYFIVEVRK